MSRHALGIHSKRLTEDFILVCKELIEKGDLSMLQEEVRELLESEQAFDIIWDYTILKLYIHACLKKEKKIAEWILDQQYYLDPIQQIAIRKMIPYGRWLLAKN